MIQGEKRLDDIVIDGNDGDWPSKSVYCLEEKNVFLAVCNDDSCLYLMVKTGNKDIVSQAMRGGFTVWLDPKGGTKKAFGIRFPLGMENDGPGVPPGGSPGSGDETKRPMPKLPGEGRRPEMPEAEELDFSRLKRLSAQMQKMEITMAEKKPSQMVPLDSSTFNGLSAKFSISEDGFLTYELKVPVFLSDSRSYGIDCSKSGKLGMTLETGKKENKKNPFAEKDGFPGGMSGGSEGGMPGGGMPDGGMPGGGMGGPGGMPGGGRGGPQGGRPGMKREAEKFTFKAQISLASISGKSIDQ